MTASDLLGLDAKGNMVTETIDDQSASVKPWKCDLCVVSGRFLGI